MSTVKKIMQELKKKGSEQTRKIFMRGDRYPQLQKHQRPVKASSKKKSSAGPRKASAGAKKHKKSPRKKPKKVSRKKPTKKQQTHRANKNMRRSYGGHQGRQSSRRGGRRG